MNKSTIEFCHYTWNPIVGCSFHCPYCYARRFNNRFNAGSDFNTPVFHPERLGDPSKVKKGSEIFVCSMADIFSYGVEVSWVEQILKVVRENPHHTFKFLSKAPISYRNFDFPSNVWIGTSVSKDTLSQRQRLTDLLSCGCKHTSFVLVEPLLGNMTYMDFTGVDFVYVGAQTGPGSIKPDRRWITSIKHPNIVLKENIKKYL
jgi:protein gp37